MHHSLIKVITGVIFLGLSCAASAQLIENENYQKITPAVQLSEKNTTVVEFFSYGCPYCEKLEPELEKWLAQKADNITFIRVAIPRKGNWLDYAKLYYSLEMISSQEAERITPLLYHAIHIEKMDFSQPDSLLDWTVKQGIDKEKLTHYFYSKEVVDKVENAMTLAKEYQLQYVPSIYVNGQYQLILNSQNQYKNTVTQLNELIQLANKK